MRLEEVAGDAGRSEGVVPQALRLAGDATAGGLPACPRGLERAHERFGCGAGHVQRRDASQLG